MLKIVLKKFNLTVNPEFSLKISPPLNNSGKNDNGKQKGG